MRYRGIRAWALIGLAGLSSLIPIKSYAQTPHEMPGAAATVPDFEYPSSEEDPQFQLRQPLPTRDLSPSYRQEDSAASLHREFGYRSEDGPSMPSGYPLSLFEYHRQRPASLLDPREYSMSLPTGPARVDFAQSGRANIDAKRYLDELSLNLSSEDFGAGYKRTETSELEVNIPPIARELVTRMRAVGVSEEIINNFLDGYVGNIGERVSTEELYNVDTGRAHLGLMALTDAEGVTKAYPTLGIDNILRYNQDPNGWRAAIGGETPIASFQQGLLGKTPEGAEIRGNDINLNVNGLTGRYLHQDGLQDLLRFAGVVSGRELAFQMTDTPTSPKRYTLGLQDKFGVGFGDNFLSTGFNGTMSGKPYSLLYERDTGNLRLGLSYSDFLNYQQQGNNVTGNLFGVGYVQQSGARSILVPNLGLTLSQSGPRRGLIYSRNGDYLSADMGPGNNVFMAEYHGLSGVRVGLNGDSPYVSYRGNVSVLYDNHEFSSVTAQADLSHLLGGGDNHKLSLGLQPVAVNGANVQRALIDLGLGNIVSGQAVFNAPGLQEIYLQGFRLHAGPPEANWGLDIFQDNGPPQVPLTVGGRYNITGNDSLKLGIDFSLTPHDPRVGGRDNATAFAVGEYRW